MQLIRISMSEILEQQELTESNVRSYPRRIPIAIKEAKGCLLRDMNGKTYFDCLAGAGTLALGYNHPEIIASLENVLKQGLPLHTLDLTTHVKQQFIEDVLGSLPPYHEKSVVQFTGPTGADAVEAALKLAKIITGRQGIFSFQGAYHGMTHGALAVTGNVAAKKDILGLMPDVFFLPYPYSYRCPFGLGGEKGENVNLHYLENVLNDPESGIKKPGAMIVEIIQGEGGVIPAPISWLQKLRKITRQHEILLIIDEVQTGMGRTGYLYAHEAAKITPDILILSKAIGGSLPLSILIIPKRFDAWKAGQHTGTFRGNQLAMAAGSTTLKIIREQNLLTHVNTLGLRLANHLEKMQRESDCIGDIRGRGLMWGVEIVNRNLKPNHLNAYPHDPLRAKAIQEKCLSLGLIIEVGGRFNSTLRFLPPLIVSVSEIDDICTIFSEALKG